VKKASGTKLAKIIIIIVQIILVAFCIVASSGFVCHHNVWIITIDSRVFYLLAMLCVFLNSLCDQIFGAHTPTFHYVDLKFLKGTFRQQQEIQASLFKMMGHESAIRK
jgi:hypothetical protein